MTNSILSVDSGMENSFIITAINEDGNLSVYGPYSDADPVKAQDLVEELAEQIQLDDSTGNTMVQVRKLGENYVPYFDE